MTFFPYLATVCPLIKELFAVTLLKTLVASFCAVFCSLKFFERVAFFGELSSKLSSVYDFYPVAPPPSTLSRQLSISWNIFCTEACLAFLVFPPWRGMPWRDFGLKPVFELLGMVFRK
jgi:hypothetical protein